MKRLFIIGAMRSGTSSISSYLKQHPDVFESEVKEPNFMVFEDNSNTFTRSDSTLFTPGMPALSLENYNHLYKKALPSQIVIDASTSYISYPQAARSIYKHFPDAYIFVILRNPVERAISAYKFNRARGTESRHDFAEILEDELTGRSNNVFAPWKYIHCGRYEQNLEPYMEIFPKNRMMIQEFTEFKRNPNRVLENITRFLDLSPYQFNTEILVNTSAAPNVLSRSINKLLLKYSTKLHIVKRTLKRLFQNISTGKLIAYTETLTLFNFEDDKSFKNEAEILTDIYKSDKGVHALVNDYYR